VLTVLAMLIQVVGPRREVVQIVQDILGVLDKSLPYGVGVALGLVNLALDYRDVRGNIQDLRRQLLRAAVAFLVATEVGATKLGVGSSVDVKGCQDAIKAAIILSCGVQDSKWCGAGVLHLLWLRPREACMSGALAGRVAVLSMRQSMRQSMLT
jgi:hypothetical protein